MHYTQWTAPTIPRCRHSYTMHYGPYHTMLQTSQYTSSTMHYTLCTIQLYSTTHYYFIHYTLCTLQPTPESTIMYNKNNTSTIHPPSTISPQMSRGHFCPVLRAIQKRPNPHSMTGNKAYLIKLSGRQTKGPLKSDSILTTCDRKQGLSGRQK